MALHIAKISVTFIENSIVLAEKLCTTKVWASSVNTIYILLSYFRYGRNAFCHNKLTFKCSNKRFLNNTGYLKTFYTPLDTKWQKH